LIAIISGNFISPTYSGRSTWQYSEKHLLAIATMLLGFGMDLRQALNLPPSYWGYILASVIMALISAQIIMRGSTHSMRWTMGAGQGICGNSAIAATAPVVGATTTEIGVSVATVNLLGTFGIILFPMISSQLNLPIEASALLFGSVLQSVGHVAGAGQALGPEVLSLALLVKMVRILWLGPAVLLIGWLITRTNYQASTGQGSTTVHASGVLSVVPWYVWGFLISSLIVSTGLIPPYMENLMKDTGKYLLLLAMTGIGLGINIRQLILVGPAAGLGGTLIFVLQTLLIMLLLKL
jgi:uncharacterized integral membrane protein (TIGR00698 family)